MSYKSYKEYINSEIDWIGQIPSSWKLLKSKFIFNRINFQSTTGNEELLSVSEYYGVRPKKETINEGDFLSRSESLIGYKKCSKNDLVMNIMLAWKKGLGVTNYDGIVSPAYEIFNINTELAYPRYMNYLLRTDLYASEFKRHSYGVIDSRLRLYPDNFKEVECILPPLKEQQQIANYLDQKTAKIDATIAKNEELIRLLEEKRVALINQVVTKGLNPDSPMKDSGVEWIGEIPEHWSLIRNKHIFNKKKVIVGNNWEKYPVLSLTKNGVIIKDINRNEGKMPSDFSIYQIVNPDNLLMCLFDIDVTPRCIGYIENKGIVSAAYTELSTTENICMKYYYYWYLMLDFDKRLLHLSKNLRNSLSTEDFMALPVVKPAIKEQKEIVHYLDSEISKIDKIILKVNKNINLLEEYKTSLIHHVVTGKIDVRGDEI